MDVMRTAVSALALYDPDRQASSADANLRKAYRLTGQIAGIVAAIERIRNGQDLVPPDATLKHAANFIYMLTGKKPSATAEKAMDVALILHADHELNASTFAGRVTAATLSDVHSAVTSAIGALKGPLHGGANIDVMRMLLEIGEVSKVEAWLKEALASKKKISGFGHRVYHTEDPRATHLRTMSKELCESSGNGKWFEMSRLIEETMKREKNINANVDFYSATVYYTLGIAVDLFTPIFAVSRISGWTAHILEQLGNNRLIRPRAEYLGPAVSGTLHSHDRAVDHARDLECFHRSFNQAPVRNQLFLSDQLLSSNADCLPLRRACQTEEKETLQQAKDPEQQLKFWLGIAESRLKDVIVHTRKLDKANSAKAVSGYRTAVTSAEDCVAKEQGGKNYKKLLTTASQGREEI